MAVKALNKNFEKLRESEQNGNESVGGGKGQERRMFTELPSLDFTLKCFS